MVEYAGRQPGVYRDHLNQRGCDLDTADAHRLLDHQLVGSFPNTSEPITKTASKIQEAVYFFSLIPITRLIGKYFRQSLANRFNLIFGHYAGEGDCDPTVAEIFRYREVSVLVAEHLDHVQLQVDWGKIRSGRDTLLS